MTLIELFKELGERITIMKTEMSDEERAIENAQTALINNSANNMIKIADIVLRTERLEAETKTLVSSKLKDVIG